ncbi:hypothetical protein KUCAC02_020147 [Chaenocephalus aceratus]|uniref:Uncharacterized protein n=1 Tax=Chaenocephalus aceratus TaxID=36190 RepID=A0ACB9VRI7_CHAAC|nr:hypothetical protein KUCAC02_020147 [Chaenocephalus aceratus]
MQLDIAVDLLRKTKTTLEDYRATGFASAQISAKDMCENMDVDAVLKEKRLRSTKRQFSYEAPDEPMANALKRWKLHFSTGWLMFASLPSMRVLNTWKKFKQSLGCLSTSPNCPETS